MQEPKISWYVKLNNENEYIAAKEVFAGTYTQNRDIEATVELWNNRYGTEDVEALKNFTLQLSFKSLEDSSLLKFCSVTYSGKELRKDIAGDSAIFYFPSGTFLSGNKNNGVKAENSSNFLSFSFKFHADGSFTFKENDLKDLFFTVVQIN